MVENEINAGYAGSAVTITPVSYLGNSAVLMQTTANDGDTVAGGIYSIDSVTLLLDNFFGANKSLGFPWSTKPASLQGYYKDTLAGGDSIEFIIILTAWDSAHHGRDTVASVTKYYSGNVASYSLITVPITYNINNIMPDTALIATGLVGPNGGNSHLGSKYYIDDLSFNGTVPLDVKQISLVNTDARLCPNPFTDRAVLAISNTVILSGATLQISNVLGQAVQTIHDINTNTVAIEKGNLQSGIYFYRLVNKDVVISTGKFVIE